MRRTGEAGAGPSDLGESGFRSTPSSNTPPPPPSAPPPPPGKKRSLPRFSLRRLLHPVARSWFGPVRVPPVCQMTSTTVQGEPSSDVPKVALDSRLNTEDSSAASRVSVSTEATLRSDGLIECPLCLNELAPEYFPGLMCCPHRSCYDCFQVYLRVEITESRIGITCPQCSEPMHPNDIRMILNDKTLYEKYEDFMVRRVLAVDPDTRWCPAPDCSYAVIAAGCASCPKIKCERPGCNAYFCYHCKAAWHPNQTCDAARAQRSPNVRSSSLSFSQDSQHRDDIKPCPRCQVLIVKMDDGSCNHMTCAVCGAEFCWLCMKEISDLHYLSPSGCTFWGKKPWSRKKKILWQLGTLVGAPVGIGLVAGIAVPAIIIGIPVWVGKKLYTRYLFANKHKRNVAIAGGVTASILISPILAGLAVGIGVPILLFYVYGVVPVSLCRSGGCGVTTSATGGVRFDFDDETEADILGALSAGKPSEADTASHRTGNPSIGEASLSLGSGSGLEREPDRESASFQALAGSISSANNNSQRVEVEAEVTHSSSGRSQRHSISSAETASDDGGASTRGLAGSLHSGGGGGGPAGGGAVHGGGGCSPATSREPSENSVSVRFHSHVSYIQIDSPLAGRKLVPAEEAPSTSRTVSTLRTLFFQSSSCSEGPTGDGSRSTDPASSTAVNNPDSSSLSLDSVSLSMPT